MTHTLFPTVILAGGLATRLKPVTVTVPKALIPIHHQPFIYHQLRLLHQLGIRKVVLCVGYLGEMIEEYLGNGEHLGMEVHYAYDGDILLGTGGAIKKALPLLPEHFFVVYGDSFLNCNYADIQADFMMQGKRGLMTVFHNQGQWDTSNVEYSQGNILAYDKKYRTERMHYIDYGLGVFSKAAFDLVPHNQPYDLATLYQTLLNQQQLAAYEVKNRFYEIGSFVGIKELEYYLSQSKNVIYTKE